MSSTNIVNNGTISDDEEVASGVLVNQLQRHCRRHPGQFSFRSFLSSYRSVSSTLWLHSFALFSLSPFLIPSSFCVFCGFCFVVTERLGNGTAKKPDGKKVHQGDCVQVRRGCGLEG